MQVVSQDFFTTKMLTPKAAKSKISLIMKQFQQKLATFSFKLVHSEKGSF